MSCCRVTQAAYTRRHSETTGFPCATNQTVIRFEAVQLFPCAPSDWGCVWVNHIDSVQEMQVIQNTYDAPYGKSGAGVVTIVSKGGSNAFHGGAYDYLRNDNLDAHDWSDNNAGVPRSEPKRNQFGGYISGPILKRANLFFYAGYEGLREPRTDSSGFWTVRATSRRASTPTAWAPIGTSRTRCSGAYCSNWTTLPTRSRN